MTTSEASLCIFCTRCTFAQGTRVRCMHPHTVRKQIIASEASFLFFARGALCAQNACFDSGPAMPSGALVRVSVCPRRNQQPTSSQQIPLKQKEENFKSLFCSSSLHCTAICYSTDAVPHISAIGFALLVVCCCGSAVPGCKQVLQRTLLTVVIPFSASKREVLARATVLLDHKYISGIHMASCCIISREAPLIHGNIIALLLLL